MFSSERERLGWLLKEAEKRLTDASVDCVTDGKLYEFLVTSSWIETVLMQAKGMRVLIEAQLDAATGPTIRALWELWSGWRYFFRVPDRRHAAAKVLISGQFEILAHAQAHAADLTDRELATARKCLDDWQANEPAAFGEVAAQRKQRRFHWSGQTHTALEHETFPYPGVYKVLSWDAHSVLGPIRDFRTALGEKEVRFVFGRRDDDPLIDPEHLAYTTGAIVFFTYADYAHAWCLPGITLPEESANVLTLSCKPPHVPASPRHGSRD